MQLSTVLATVFAAVAVSTTGLDAQDTSDLVARHGGKDDGDMDPNMPGMDMSGSKKNMTMGSGSAAASAAKLGTAGAGSLAPGLMGVLGAIGLVALGQSM